MEELKQSDLIVKKERQIIRTAELAVESGKGIPIGYIPVTFCSKDKLCPSILHFRNYSMSELLELASCNDDNQFDVLVHKALNEMIYEDYDCSNLHIEHIKQIVLTIYKNFWNSTLFNRPYYKDLQGDFDSEDNIAYTDINLSKISTIDITDEFKNKFTIESNGIKAKFILPTVGHIFVANAYVKQKYAEAESKFSDLLDTMALVERLKDSKQIEQAESIKFNEKEKEEYDAIQLDKNRDYIKILQAQLIYSVEDKVLETADEKYDAYVNKIDATFWIHYKEVVDQYAKFGINSNYEFVVDGEKLTRGFSFRPMVFIPSLDTKTNSRYTVHFED